MGAGPSERRVTEAREDIPRREMWVMMVDSLALHFQSRASFCYQIEFMPDACSR
jgi:hypothetical protein